MEATGDFTVCCPYPGMGDEVMFCGTRSGRRCDKMEECNFTALPSGTIKTPGIDECGIIWECRTLYHSDIDPEALSPEIGAYAAGDYHRVYYGIIQRCVADEDIEERFPVG
jgi:flavin reductase (DIM6/NTAB) family NADH-FMN oxidoreductase RutF